MQHGQEIIGELILARQFFFLLFLGDMEDSGEGIRVLLMQRDRLDAVLDEEVNDFRFGSGEVVTDETVAGC